MNNKKQSNSMSGKIIRESSREEPKSVLIVTEGRKTEKEYFDALIRRLRVGADIDAPRNGDSSPISVVNRAKKAIKRDETEYDIIYCVFDKDNRTYSSYDEAIRMIKNLNRRHSDIEINAIPSVPSIEYWLYLHTGYLDRPYSNAREMEKDLKRIPQFKRYNKSITSDLFKYLFKNRQTAKDNAARSVTDGKHRLDKMYHENPSTRIHVILKKLEEFSSIL